MPQPRKPKELLETKRVKLARIETPDHLPLSEINPEPPEGKTQLWHNFFFNVIQITRDLGTDSYTDLASVIELCDLHEEVQQLRKLCMDENGKLKISVKHGKTDNESINPNYRALNMVRPLYIKMLDTFGMTPRGRAYLTDKRKDPTNRLTALLNQAGDNLQE